MRIIEFCVCVYLLFDYSGIPRQTQNHWQVLRHQGTAEEVDSEEERGETHYGGEKRFVEEP